MIAQTKLPVILFQDKQKKGILIAALPELVTSPFPALPHKTNTTLSPVGKVSLLD